MEEENRGCFKFHPLEQELVHYAIQRAIEGPISSSVGEGIIKDCSLYEIEPQDLLQDAAERGGGGEVVYVFTKLKKKGENGKRIDRTVAGKGTWKEKAKVKTFYNQRNQVIGWRRGFAYSPNSKSPLIANEYRMNEYSLHNSVLTHAKFKDYVLCKIKKIKHKKIKNIDGDEDSPQGNDSLSSMSPGSLSEPSQPGQLIEAFSINGDEALVEFVPMSIDNQEVPLTCGDALTASEESTPAAQLFSAPSPPGQLLDDQMINAHSLSVKGGDTFNRSVTNNPARIELFVSEFSNGDRASSFEYFAPMSIENQAPSRYSFPCAAPFSSGFLQPNSSAAALRAASSSTASQAEPLMVELSAISPYFHQATAAQDSRQPEHGFNDLASAAVPVINPSPSTNDYDHEDDYDGSLDWLTYFAAQLRQFLSEPLENSEEVEMLPNPMALLILDEMFFK